MSAPPAARRPAAPSLLERLDAAAELGDVDARQLADALGLTVAGLRAALDRPALLAAEHAPVVAAALGLDAGAVRALRRASSASGDPTAPPDAAPVGPAPTLVALLEATVGAVAGDDAAAAAFRREVLDLAAAAARAAGRVLPPGAHELRARVARGEFAAPSEAPHESSEPAGSDAARDAALVAEAAALVRELQRAEAGYNGLFAPLADEALDALLRRFGVAAHDAAGAGATARFALTPVLFGRHRLLRAAEAAPDQRRLAARAALAHLVVGHAGDARPLACPAPEEQARLADVVALADLVPFWLVADLRRRGRLGWRALAEHVGGLAGRAAGDWGAERAGDRGMLRVALFRTHAL